ncbi:MAG: hypothetical protein GXO34_06290 [Deltaproteobacteria bacterium]|nr:hypothetical protein [Deltaproteobacteria bacterium]
MKINLKERQKIVDFGLRMVADHLTTGTGGNLSLALRLEKKIFISPSGIPYDQLEADDISVLDFSGRHLAGKAPSSEWHLHLELYRNRPEINAVVHTHSRFATTFAVLNQPIPACHYLIGISGADQVRVAPYATFGTPELARVTAVALKNDNCILMANHGLITVGKSLDDSYNTALYIEEVAELYYRARSLGEPILLSADQMQEAKARFRTYGRQTAMDLRS